MGSIVTDTRIEPNSSESISGFRSGLGENPVRPENVCDLKVTALDPFDFKVDWRIRYVKNRRKRVLRNGHTRTYYVSVPTPYPYYIFAKKVRTVKEWRLLLKAGAKVKREISFNAKHIDRIYDQLMERLANYGPCRPTKPRSVDKQHNVTNMVSTTLGNIAPKYVINGPYSVQNAAWDVFGYRSAELFGTFVGDLGNGPYYIFDQTMRNKCINEPMAAVFSNNTVETITAMLWPSSGDFEDIGSTPLIDIAEAVSDGVFPLGPPPDPVEAHKRLSTHAMDDKILRSIKETVDFAADTYLWTTLVLEPVIQSAIGLAASVEANDKAIDAYNKRAQSGQWHQGKNLRLFKGASKCFGAWDSYAYDPPGGPSEPFYLVEHQMEYNNFDANASFYYKLNEVDAAIMNTSGMRLGQFFNRMSTSMHDVFHNIVPLSFVYDWFSSNYSGLLNLENKVYMPVDDWKLILSYNLDMSIKTSGTTRVRVVKYRRDTGSRTKNCYDEPAIWISGSVSTVMVDEDWVLPDDYCVNAGYYKYQYRYVMIDDNTVEDLEETTEQYKYYHRQVFLKPVRRTVFDGATTYATLGIDCLAMDKDKPLEDTGKQITLGALIWGMAPNPFNLL